MIKNNANIHINPYIDAEPYNTTQVIYSTNIYVEDTNVHKTNVYKNRMRLMHEYFNKIFY